MKQKVVVIGNSFATRLSVIRSVAQIGCEVVVVDIGYFNSDNPPKPIDCYSKYVSQVVYFDRKLGREGLVKMLLEKCVSSSGKTIIIPTSDFSAVSIDNEEIKEKFLVPYINNETDSIECWMDKIVQKDTARRVGLNVADAVVVDQRDGYAIPNGIKYPCFTKPLASIGGGKNCLSRCDNEEELKSILKVARVNGIQQILVEDFLNINNEYAVLGFSDGEKVIIPGVIHFVRGSQSHRGIAMIGEIMPITGFESLIDLFSKYVLEIGFVGLFDIDFFESGDKYYFGEMNLRIGGSAMAVSKMGVNLSAMLVKSLKGEDVDNMQKKVDKVSIFVNERICLDDWLDGKISTFEMNRIIQSADIRFSEDEEDNTPYLQLEREIKKGFCNYKRIIKRFYNIIKA